LDAADWSVKCARLHVVLCQSTLQIFNERAKDNLEGFLGAKVVEAYGCS